jgi:hypothetical protein
MPADPPIACSLSAAELPERMAEIEAIGRDALRAVETSGTRAVLRFHAAPGIRDRLAAIVAAESRCCAFLDMELRAGANAIELTIEAPAGAEPVVHELVTAFRAGARCR